MKLLILILALCFSAVAEDDLAAKLDDLNIPSDKVNSVVSRDKLYVVNTRYSSLENRHEFTVVGAKNFNAESNIETQQAGASYRYHLNADWSFGLKYLTFSNELSDSGKALFNDKSLLPDTDYASNSTEILASYNTIYGKLRLSKSRIVYFDQYIALGLGQIELASGATQLFSLDLGLAFWLGKNFSARVGLKNDFYQSQQLARVRNVHNSMGYLEFGYLFGGSSL